jgi:glucose uptake protein GlcU
MRKLTKNNNNRHKLQNEFKVKETIGPGMLAGLFWAIGNYCGTYAILYLGMAIGFPLTQANIIIAGLWGKLY